MEKLQSTSVKCSIEQFQQAVDIYVLKPHSVNKRLVGSMTLSKVAISSDSKTHHVDRMTLIQELRKRPVPSDTTPLDDCRQCMLRKLISKSGHEKYEYVCKSLEADGCQYLFVPVDDTSSDHSFVHEAYGIEFTSGSVTLLVHQRTEASHDCSSWLKHNLLRQVVKWCQEDKLSITDPSLKLVPLDRYNETYNRLKEKYVETIARNWTESTNPEKFIHEDIGIATYLLLLWEEERTTSGSDVKQSFVDLGCGNGLLVFLLSQEGHPGVGLDIRKRKIWDSLAGTDLCESVIDPSKTTRFPDSDWLIGNHSDELTPWIPVMAALTSHRTRFFVLPCCPFEFTAKFQRRNQKLSLYRDYLNYVKEVGERCGFVMEEDRLKIPSTKRICFVGRTKSHDEKDWAAKTSEIIAMLPTTTDSESARPNKRLKTEDFVPRKAEETVRNCTKVDKSVTDTIIDLVVKRLLSEPKPLEASVGSDLVVDNWNRGTVCPLSDIAQLVPVDLLKRLKSECGGLQTLFRNHNFIFIIEKGTVRLRCPATDSVNKGKKRVTKDAERFRKSKLCWFYENHPQKCPVRATECHWAHGKEDLAKLE